MTTITNALSVRVLPSLFGQRLYQPTVLKQPSQKDTRALDQFQRLYFGSATEVDNPYQGFPRGHSWYLGVSRDGTLFSPSDPSLAIPADIQRTVQPYVEFIQSHPCLGAHAAFVRNNIRVGVYPPPNNPEALLALLHDLRVHQREFPAEKIKDDPFTAFIAIFRDEQHKDSELAYIKQYWQTISILCALDRRFNPWPQSLIDKIRHKDFAPFLNDTEYFMPLFSPKGHRSAHRTPDFALVINRMEQFDHIRSLGMPSLFELLSGKIRQRDARHNERVGGPSIPNPALTPKRLGDAYLCDGYDHTVDSNFKPKRGCPFVLLDPDDTWREVDMALREHRVMEPANISPEIEHLAVPAHPGQVLFGKLGLFQNVNLT